MGPICSLGSNVPRRAKGARHLRLARWLLPLQRWSPPFNSRGGTPRRKVRRTSTLTVLSLWAALATVQAEFTCTTNNGSITITGYTGPAGTLAVPSSINGWPVTSIGSHAFENYTSLTSITIPGSVTEVGAWAFSYCSGLAALTMSNGVARIEDGAFNGCSSLTTVEIPDSVTFLGGYAFAKCPGLMNVAVGSSVTGIAAWTFEHCTSLTNVTIPDSVKSIGQGAFWDCQSLPKVTLGNGVTAIGDSAFYGCAGLTCVTLPRGATTIGDSAFQYCFGLTNVMIPDSVTHIGNYAFEFCTGLNAACFWGAPPTVGSGPFEGADLVTVYYLPGVAGWEPTFGERPAAPWVLGNPIILNCRPRFGVGVNGFGFIISWATHVPVVVEASPDPSSFGWSPVSTNTLVNGWSYFSDAQWTNYPTRFYRVRSQ